ncbi:zinc finger FYVE domain-containing protein 26-like [Physella acuta]|uniref:zinc finger FYVE domain-containing protein 26-like n=1 Tax=Physella acuta TaxID=109671 RepID=UPI0027DDB4D1|nr:zinc finger FYVE domain-containing protein 26-like [Physella acuta]
MELVSMILLCSDFKVSFDLATRIVKECRLNPALTFTHCSRELAKLGRFDDIIQLTKALTSAGLVDEAGIDEIVGASLLVIADTQALDQSDTLIQLLTCDNNKINAFILCGKLRSAYLLAVKRDRVEDVQRIAGAAQRLGQTAVRNICKKWLEQHKNLDKQP